MAWSPIYNIIRMSLLQTRHRTRHINMEHSMAHMLGIEAPLPVLTILFIQLLFPEVRGRHRREVCVWLQKLLPTLLVPMAVGWCVMVILARVRLTRSFPFI